jgi:hypothetical protein
VIRIARSLSLRSSRCIVTNMALKRRDRQSGAHARHPLLPVLAPLMAPGAGGRADRYAAAIAQGSLIIRHLPRISGVGPLMHWGSSRLNSRRRASSKGARGVRGVGRSPRPRGVPPSRTVPVGEWESLQSREEAVRNLPILPGTGSSKPLPSSGESDANSVRTGAPRRLRSTVNGHRLGSTPASAIAWA